MTDPARQRLDAILRAIPGPLAVAVSGGVDSLTLMAVAAAVRREPTAAVHATSPAVPEAATLRVRQLATDRGWQLRVIDAGEFADPRYRANPLNRCYFCKTNLFAAMRMAAPDAVLATGTNTDDLGDFRPGLAAAREHGVRQPFVDAGIGKAAIRAIARAEGLPEIAALPAQPCLASRIETGIAVLADDLAFVSAIERTLTDRLGPGDHRCRITRSGVVAQVPAGCVPLGDAQARADLERALAALCARTGRRFAGLEAYRRGSAFLRTAEAQGQQARGVGTSGLDPGPCGDGG